MNKFIDLIGQRFGKLMVVKYVGNNKECRGLWLCLCDCGKETTVSSGHLRSGGTLSCGCYNKRRASETHFVDLTGQTFGRLKVIKEAGRNKEGRVLWLCKCSCGNEKIISGSNLRRVATRSCGCLKVEKSKGKNSHRWNPDRELVKLNKITKDAVGAMLYRVLKKTGKTKTTKSEIMLGYTRLVLMAYVESKFLPGMSWSNWGEWHIDHIKPISAFVKEGITDPKIICALDNLQPLWAADNIRKKDKWK